MAYQRIMLKLSGESLAGKRGQGIDDDQVKRFASLIKSVHDMGIQLAIVVGGGNYWRGRTNPGMDRVTADQIGMLATTMNAMALADAVRQTGADCRVLNAIDMPRITESFVQAKAKRYLNQGQVLIFAGGTGSPFFSTDSAAALRAAEIGADLVLKGTLVDGIYDKDPKIHPDAVKYDEISLADVLAKDLKVIDAAAAAICRDNKLLVQIFNITEPNNLLKILKGEKLGSLIYP